MSKDYDPNFRVPDGFEPWLCWPEDFELGLSEGQGDGVPYIGRALLKIGEEKIGFEIGKDSSLAPKLPLKATGKIWHRGWDIPTRYAIDAEKNCYMDSAHGGGLSRVKPEALLNTAQEDSGQYQHIRSVLGLKPAMPEWMKEALAAGWSPPAGWSQDDYE